MRNRYNALGSQRGLYRETPCYPSAKETKETKAKANTSMSVATKQEYTGTYVTGIATMHKSNSIPVTNFEQAKDLARMRR